MNYHIVILLLSLILATGCTRHNHDERLVKVAEMLADKPEEGLTQLDSIDADELSNRDRVYYDFLTVKGRDKAFITHTSDSLIKIVLDEVEQHPDADYYAEVLYYAGRVYSDMNDYPTALRYFQSALDLLPPETSDIILRRNVLNQTARLYDNLKLFKEAVPIMEQTLEINRQLKDTIGLIHDLQLLGHIHIRNHQYKSAEPHIREALKISTRKSAQLHAKSLMLLAAIKYKQGDLDAALRLIRHTPDSVEPITRNLALAYAADIYLAKGITDTAYACAYELIHGKDSQNKLAGYRTMLSPLLRNIVGTDRTDRYIEEYRWYVGNLFDENENQLAINQQSYYNYQLHDRDKMAAEKSSKRLKNVAVICLFAILVLIIGVMYFKNLSKNRVIELQRALDNIDKLYEELGVLKKRYTIERMALDFSDPEDKGNYGKGTALSGTEKELQNRLKKDLLALYEKSKNQIETAPDILHSSAYATLQEFIAQGKCIEKNHSLWGELEEAVSKSAPNFKGNLLLLTSDKLTVHDFHTALLIKCGIQPLQMATLLGKSKGTIVWRRDTLSIKIFGEKLGTKVIDAIIRLL